MTCAHIRINPHVLGAIARFAGDQLRSSLGDVLFGRNEIVATNGHVMVRLPLNWEPQLEEPFAINAAILKVVAEAAISISGGGLIIERGPRSDTALGSVTIRSSMDSRLSFEVRAKSAFHYPDHKLVDSHVPAQPEGDPPHIELSVTYISLITDLARAMGTNTAVFERWGGPHDMTVFRVGTIGDARAKVYLMPMRTV